MLQEKLKATTAALHDELESLMFVGQIMQRTLSREDYIKLLTTNFLIHQQYEAQIHQQLFPATATALDINARTKLEALKTDLLEAGLDYQEICDKYSCKEKSIPNESFAMGALYVLEGATLGGNVIVKQIRQNPHFEGLNYNFHYYSCYGDQLVAKWQQFVKTLNEMPENAQLDAEAGALFLFHEIIALAKRINETALASENA